MPLWEKLSQPVPAFVARHGLPPDLKGILSALKQDIEQGRRDQRTWHDAFDDVRDAAGVLWPGLPGTEKRRFLRHLKAWYDVHRFRLPPQTGEILKEAAEGGQLTIRPGRILSVEREAGEFAVEVRGRGEGASRREKFSAVINSTGPRNQIIRSSNPFIGGLLSDGFARPDDAGIGLDVDENCRALRPDGGRLDGLYLLGPPGHGRFGETPAVPFITRQILRIIPHLIGGLSVLR